MAYLDERFQGNNHFWGRLYYTENSVSTANNTSNITLKLVMFPESSSYSFHGYTNTGHIYVSGTEKASGSNSGYVQYGSENVLCSWTGDIAHDADGSKTIWISFRIDSNYCGASVDGTNFYLTKIDRYPVITSAPNFTDADNPTMYFTTNTISGATYNACISLTGAKDDVPYRQISVGSGNYTFNLTSADRKALIGSTKPGQSKNVTFYLRTDYNGASYFSTLTKTFTVTKRPVHLRINGEWKESYPYIRMNGQWKEAKPHTRVSGQWKEEI